MTAPDPRIEALAKAFAGETDPLGVWEEQEQGYRNWYALPATRLLKAVDEVDPLRQPGHVLEIRPTSYGIQHPPECRPHLLDCELEILMSEEEKAPALPGRYPAEVSPDGELILGPRLEP